MIKILNIFIVFFSLGVVDSHDGTCPETRAGQQFALLIITDLILVTIVSTVPKWVMFKLPKLGPLPTGKKAPFELPKEVMELVYRQALLWVGSLFMPFIFWL